LILHVFIWKYKKYKNNKFSYLIHHLIFFKILKYIYIYIFKYGNYIFVEWLYILGSMGVHVTYIYIYDKLIFYIYTFFSKENNIYIIKYQLYLTMKNIKIKIKIYFLRKKNGVK